MKDDNDIDIDDEESL